MLSRFDDQIKVNYSATAEKKHQTTWRKHERVTPNIWRLKTLSFPAYIWAKRFLSPLKPKDDVLLDLGGSFGNFSYMFKDSARKMIVIDLVYGPLHGIKEDGTWKVQGDILRVPLCNNSVTRVIFSDVFEHFLESDLPVVLSEINRVMKPGGVCFLNTSCYGIYLRRYWYKLIGLAQKGRLDWADLKDGHLNRLKHREMMHLFNNEGFRVIDWRFTKHFFQPLLQILKTLLLTVLDKLKRGSIKEKKKLSHHSHSVKKNTKMKQLMRGIVNGVSYLDLLLFGKIPGGAVYYKLVKK